MLSPGAASEANWAFGQGGSGEGVSGGILRAALSRLGQLSSSPERRSDDRLRSGGHNFASRGASKRGATAGERPACCQPPARLHSGNSKIQAEQEETSASSRPDRELVAGTRSGVLWEISWRVLGVQILGWHKMTQDSEELSALRRVSGKICSYMALKLVLTVILMASVLLTLYYFRDTTHWIERFSAEIKENMITTTIFSTLIISILMTISIPIEPILISMAFFISKIKGPTFEVFLSLFICFNATQLSTFLTVILVRSLIVKHVKERMDQYTVFSAFNEVSRERGTLLVVLIRFSLFLPFVSSNCLLGLTDISSWNLFIGNFAVIPAQISLIVFGASIYNSNPHHEPFLSYNHPKYALVLFLSAIASLALLIYIVLQKYREIKEKLEPTSEEHFLSSVPFTRIDQL
ncbi:transmembrane domain-containing protein [Cryptosporidium canis]|uniref:Transmembrane domain-containing protein n=1 Tax=Cryptosporidium canis TaxID=195482 RepID=A0A9D5DEL2_9CRYT|nr:transmembrane domain-containing protein [Cryptosporidium canis]